MAHVHLTRLASVTLAASVVAGCGGASEAQPAIATSTQAEPTKPVDAFAAAPSSYGRFPSRRFGLTLPLPDGKTWRIDDHRAPVLVATHEASASRVEVAVTHEDAVMTRTTCEARARARFGLVEGAGTVEDETMNGPGAYDTRVWVASRPSAGGTEGHVYAFGGHLRTCFFFHFVTRGEAADADALPRRLAVARGRILGGIAVAQARTDEDLDLPRARPSPAPARPKVP